MTPIFIHFNGMTAEGATTKSSDREAVRRRRCPTTKWSDSKSMYVDVVMSSDANSFEIGILRLSTFRFGTFY